MNKKVAIISYSYRLPGSRDGKLWEKLMAGEDLITQVPADRWSQDYFLHPDVKHPGTSYSFAAGTIGDIAGFDAAFFGISPREAANMDPQQRLLLELTWEALENAGTPPESLRGSNTQVIIGVSTADYANRLADDFAAIDSSTATGNAMSILANRLSYYFDFKGASHIVDTACSSSLVAFHQACQAIRSGQTALAITGGINLHLHPYGFLIFSKASMLSPTGRCHVFDAAADGYVRSEGAGIFILKDYAQALADNDPIVAVVAGSAVNTDGNKSTMAVPCAKSQATLIRQTCQAAGLEPDEFNYFEAHGTGTQVGDPVEAEAIGIALGRFRKNPLPIGSIKSNLGHLEAGAGVASLVKSIQTLENKCIPPSIGFNTPNPNINFADLKLEVVTSAQKLKDSTQLTVGLNSFGFGGANAHVILQNKANPNPLTGPICRAAEPLPIFLSARSPEALKQSASDLAAQLSERTATPLYDIAYSTGFHRQQLKYRALFEVNSTSAAIEKLTDFSDPDNENKSPGVYTQQRVANPHGPVFVYSGNGCQWPEMGKELVEKSSVFRQAVEKIDQFFIPLSGYSLIAELAGGNGENRLEQTEVAQPALFALQVGITQLLRKEGITAKAVTGHSVGEIAAAWASGALSLQNAVKVIYHRSQHQGRTKGQGQMTAVNMAEQGLDKLLSEVRFASLSLAGINSPRGCTVAGPGSALAIFEAELVKREVPFKRLALDYAFHSPVMDPIEAGIRQDLSSLKTHTGKIPFISTVTGEEFDGQLLDAEYWWHNIRKPVRFHQAIAQLVDEKYNLFVEIGGHPILQNYLKETLREGSLDGAVIPSISRNNNRPEAVTETARKVLLAGVDTGLERWFPARGNFVRLPNYPWQKERHWVSPSSESLELLQRYNSHPLLGYPLAQHINTWETQLDTQRLPWLKDHKVGESVVFPAAGFAETVCAVADITAATETIEIEEFEIYSPLLLNEQSKVVRTELQNEQRTVVIESRNQGENTTWARHLKARLVAEPTNLGLTELSLELPQQKSTFNRQDHQEIMERAGLGYGPTFATINYGWATDNQVIAALQIPDEASHRNNKFYLHPGLLDSTFQLCAHLLRNRYQTDKGVAYIPTRIERIHLASDKRTPAYATVQLTTKSPHSMVAELALFDANKNAIARYRGVRLKEIRLHKAAQQTLSYLDYHLTPAPRNAGKGTARIAPLLQQSLLKTLSSWNNCDLNLEFIQEVEPLLETLSTTYLTDALKNLADTDEVISEHQSSDENLAGLQKYLISVGTSQGILQPLGKGWQLNLPDQEEMISTELIWNTLVREYPGYLQAILAVGRAGLALQARLAKQGNHAPPKQQDDLFSQLIAGLHRKGFAQQLAQQLAISIDEHKKSLAVGERFSIVEVGHDGPLLAEMLCPDIDFRICEYGVLAASESAVESAVALQQQHRKMAIYTPGEPIDTADKQLALVHLNFLNQKEFSAALAEVRQMLVPGATILFIGQHAASWLDFVLNVVSDENISPAWTCKQVEQFLKQRHLQLNTEFNSLTENSAGPYLLLAEQPQIDEPVKLDCAAQDKTGWLFIVSSDEREKQLAEALTISLVDKNQRAATLCVSSATELEEKLSSAIDSLEQCTNIVHLNGIYTARNAAVIQRCEIASAIIRQCEDGDKSRTLWLLTHGVMEIFPCDQAWRERPTSLAQKTPADAALWGFARSAMNEAGRLTIRLTDVPAEMTTSCQAALLEEWLTPSNETELCLTPQGARLAPRLRRVPAPAEALAEKPDTPVTTLNFRTPGQLRNLCWETGPPLSPAADEMEIEVLATGLNFRDVMYTLGLLSDEALENGFAGASLGLEFTGKVIQVGAEPSDFVAGDLVVGFGSASFSNRLLVKADAVARLPDQIDPVAAASIPTAFITAYYALHHCARLQPGEKVLIHGAAGGVGIAAIQIAQWLGAEVYATAGSAEKRDFLTLLGVDNIYDSRTLNFAEKILAESVDGEGVDVILNSLAGEAMQRNFRVLKPFGRFLEIGKRDFYENTGIGLRPFRNNISYFGIDADQLRLRTPELANRLFKELLQLFAAGELHPLPYTLFNANHVEQAFRYMQQAKQIGKIIVNNYADVRLDKTSFQTTELPQLALPEKGSYLITGGVSGLGLRLGQWLADRGAKHLLLCSRRGEVAETDRPTLDHFAELGVAVHTLSCDVSKRSNVEALLEFCQTEMPALKGIIHAATTIEDGLIRNQTDQQLRSGMSAKVLGAQHLHELSTAMDLDLFILISSATTLFGNPGQSSYVAANHWLEALAAHRHALGLPATCIRLGAIEDVGFLADNQELKKNLQNRMGGTALHSKDVVQAIEQLLMANSETSLGYLELDWTTLKRFLPDAAAAKFSEINLETGDKPGEQEQQLDLQQMLQELSTEELHIELIKILTGELSRILLIPENKIDPNCPLHEIGLDSLMGVELTASVEETLGISLPVMLLTEAPNLSKLSSYIVKTLQGEEQDASEAETSQLQGIAAQHGIELADANATLGKIQQTTKP